jgi:hypothetical protein
MSRPMSGLSAFGFLLHRPEHGSGSCRNQSITLIDRLTIGILVVKPEPAPDRSVYNRLLVLSFSG